LCSDAMRRIMRANQQHTRVHRAGHRADAAWLRTPGETMTESRFARPLLVAVVVALGMPVAQADPVTISSPFMNLEHRAINSLGFTTGEFLRIGANSVTPNGTLGTTGIGTSINLLTGAPETRTIAFNSSPVSPNFFQRNLAGNPALYGPWTLTFTNGSDSASTVVSLPAGATQAPFVNTITLSGTSANPTFTWSPLPGAAVNGYRVNIFDKTLINSDPAKGPISNGNVVSLNFAPTITSHTVKASDFTVPGYGFEYGRDYSIEIGLIQTKDGSSTNLGNPNLQAISRVYADFRRTSGGGPVVNLPVVLDSGVYKFDMVVEAGKTYYIDPEVAVGYDYAIGAGNPNFKSVVLPTGVGDDKYNIYSFDAASNPVLLAHDWLAGSVFDFGATGLSSFRVDGIEESAGLDPANTTAFVTGVTFTGAGLFTGTQTPLLVPEPQTYAMFLAGLAAIGWAVRRRRAGDAGLPLAQEAAFTRT
jgi:hypothetical protein